MLFNCQEFDEKMRLCSSGNMKLAFAPPLPKKLICLDFFVAYGRDGLHKFMKQWMNDERHIDML